MSKRVDTKKLERNIAKFKEKHEEDDAEKREPLRYDLIHKLRKGRLQDIDQEDLLEATFEEVYRSRMDCTKNSWEVLGVIIGRPLIYMKYAMLRRKYQR